MSEAKKRYIMIKYELGISQNENQNTRVLRP